ncbi:dynein axonemal assembly factor 9-like isoform X1 [Saccostrea echinata]|uniref:dynein axonemal assembly factor 9-like isoform X1 n=1 Tax=Saccostrea echinata TaxID=191078 RepID=UPI002A7EE3B1|nr:dynein axonemal assembly factor 9-like isoform X1 [Saccostrea echinata]
MSQKFKRPSSARRHIKLDTFSSFVSGSRLRTVQELLKSEEHDNKPDAILCIAGIDSRYHEGSTEFIDYLLFGFFERRKAELEQSGFDEEVIDDIVDQINLILLIRRHEVDIYCNPINYHYLLPYVAHWRNLRFHCLSDSEYEDEEAAEEFKIQSFIAMVQGVRKVGIPHNVLGHPAKFDHMMIEKWPIIQAYALEDYKGGGFFTLQYEVVDIGPLLSDIYSLMDPCALEVLLTEQMTQFERQWQTLIDNLNINISTGIGRLTENKVCEPLWSYFKHGKVASQETNTIERQRQPFVLCGTNSRRIILDDVRRCKTSVNSEISQCGINDGPPKFMVCHGISPRGPLCCTRTYFFNSEENQLGAKTTQPNKVEGNSPADVGTTKEDQDKKMLVDMYSIMIDSVLEGIKQYSKTLSVHKTRARVVDQICEGCKAYPVLTKYIQRRSDIVFTLEAYDQDGRSQPVEEGSRSLLLKSAGVCLYDVPSTLIPGKTLGSLVFSEIFQDSVISVQKEDGTLELSGESLILTSIIPRYRSWPLASKVEPTGFLHNLTKYGRLLCPGETFRVCTDQSLTLPATEVELFAYEAAIVLVFQRANILLLDKDNIKSMQMYVGESSDAISVLMVEVFSSTSIPAFLQSENHILYISMFPKSKAKLTLFQEVLPEWKSHDSLPHVDPTESIPESFQQIAKQLQLEFDSEHHPTTAYHHIRGKFSNLDRFMTHFSVSNVTSLPITSLPIMLQEAEDVGTSLEEDRVTNETFHGITVTVIGGIPGSHKEQLCDTLLYLTEGHIRWTVLRQGTGDTKSLINGELQNTLSKMWNSMRRRLSSSETSNRLLLVTPGFTDIIDVLCAILNHSNPDVQQHVRIGSVTVCIDPFISFMEHRITFPNLLNQCAQGFVNNILITSATSIQQNSSLEEIQTLLRSVNPDVTFFLAEKGNVKRSMDVDAILSETAFMENKKVRAREMLCPGWSQGLYKTPPLSFTMQDTELTFSQPLVRNVFINKLRGLKSQLTHYPFSGNIFLVQGYVSFTDSEELMDVLYNVKSDHLAVTKHMDKPNINGDGHHLSRNKYCLVFTGPKLQVNQIKDWLRTCGRQKPELKKPITKKDLTKEEIKKIHKQHHLDPLPAGWFYNGTQFVSFDGEKQDLHPSLETFIQEYIDSKNKEIQEYNDTVRKNASQYVDLFA